MPFYRFTFVCFFTISILSCTDDCAKIDCGFNKVCVDGDCVCDDSFEGENCEQLLFTKIKLFEENELAVEYTLNNKRRVINEFIPSFEFTSITHQYNEDESIRSIINTPISMEIREINLLEDGVTVLEKLFYDDELQYSSEYKIEECGYVAKFYKNENCTLLSRSERVYQSDCSYEETRYDSENKPISRIVFEFDDGKKWPLSIIKHLKDYRLANFGNPISFKEYNFDDAGNIVLSKSDIYNNIYDNNGYLKSYSITNQDNEVTNYRYEYE